MDIDENQQEQEIVIPQVQIEPVAEESMSHSISPRLSRIPRFNRNSSSSPPITSTIRLNSTAAQIPSPLYQIKRDRFSSNLSLPTIIIPPNNLNLAPSTTIPPTFVSNSVPNQDVQLNIERIDLNEGASHQTRRIASINISTNVPFYNSTRPATIATSFSYSSLSYGQHQKNNIEDEGTDADFNLRAESANGCDNV